METHQSSSVDQSVSIRHPFLLLRLRLNSNSFPDRSFFENFTTSWLWIFENRFLEKWKWNSGGQKSTFWWRKSRRPFFRLSSKEEDDQEKWMQVNMTKVVLCCLLHPDPPFWLGGMTSCVSRSGFWVCTSLEFFPFLPTASFPLEFCTLMFRMKRPDYRWCPECITVLNVLNASILSSLLPSNWIFPRILIPPLHPSPPSSLHYEMMVGSEWMTPKIM